MRRGSPAPRQAKMTTKSKAAEAVLHDADARFAMPLHIGEAFGVRLSFLALSDAVTMFLWVQVQDIGNTNGSRHG